MVWFGAQRRLANWALKRGVALRVPRPMAGQAAALTTARRGTLRGEPAVSAVQRTAVKSSSGATLRRYLGSPGAASHLVNALWRHPRSWFESKRPQVQILSPRPAFAGSGMTCANTSHLRVSPCRRGSRRDATQSQVSFNVSPGAEQPSLR
jgi:hypothetical protein